MSAPARSGATLEKHLLACFKSNANDAGHNPARRRGTYHVRMNIHVLHDCRVLANMTGQTPLPCDGIVSRLGQANDIAAAWIDGNPLDENFMADVDQVSPRLLMYSGTLSSTLFGEDPRTWLKPGRAALDAFTERVLPMLQKTKRTICFRPHARHVLSDPQGTLKFLLDHNQQPFEIALSPADMIAPDMIGTIDDHLRRMFESLAPRAALVFLNDIRINAQGLARSVALGDGVLPQELVLSLIREHVPSTTPLVVSPHKLDQQLKWLRLEPLHTACT